MDYSKFRENLRKLIYSRAVSYKDIASEINISSASISRYINGDRTPDLICVIKISQYFNVSIDWLLGLTDNPNNVLPTEVQEVSDLYSIASSEDRHIIQLMLNKYRKE